jgi:hypothetical protein
MHPNDPASPSNATPETASRPPKQKFHGPGRPRTLDDGKRREICALIAGGCGLREAAKYVHCSVNTIRREAERNADFGQQLRHSENYAQLTPLRAMQGAVGTHWRAAAWMLERAFPERFGRPDAGAFGGRQARELLNEVLSIVRAEMFDLFKTARVEKRIRGAFEYHIRMACDQRRNSRSLRQAMKSFEDKDRISGPLADLGILTHDLSDFLPPLQRSTMSEPRVERNPAPERRQDPAKLSPQPPQGPRSSGTPSASQSAPHPAKRRARTDDDRPATAKDFVTFFRDALVDSMNPSPPSASTPTPPNPNIQ